MLRVMNLITNNRWLQAIYSLAIITALLIPSFVMAATASAQESRGFTVSPLVFELSANPGDKLSNKLKVDNITNQPMNMSVDLRNFVALGEEGQPGLTDEDTSFSLAKWMKATLAEKVIAPRGSETFTLDIAVPVNAEPGGHFGSVVFRTKPDTAAGSVSLVQEIGALVLLKVAGDTKEEASIASLGVLPGFSEAGPFNFEARIKNSGNVHVKPLSTITVTNMFGKEVTKLQLDSRNILPDSVRKFDKSFSKKWLFGRYTATLTSVYGSTNQVLVAQTTFWAFPVKFALIVLGVLVVLGVLIFLGRRRLALAFRALSGKELESAKEDKKPTQRFKK